MDGRERGMGFLMRNAKAWMILLLVAAAGLACACGPRIGPSQPWIGAERIQGAFRPALSPIPPDTARQPAPGGVLRVTTFNLHHADDVDAILRAIRESEALFRTDVFFFQEIREYASEPSSRSRRIAEALGMAFVYAPAKEVQERGGGTHGLAILSRAPLENVAVMELPAGRLLVDNERRIAVAADIQVSGARVHLVNVHLDTRLNATERILQLRPAVIDAPQGSLIGGDFNTNPLTWAFNALPLLPLVSSGGTDQGPLLDHYMRSIGMSTPTAGLGATVRFPLMEPRLDSFFVRGMESGGGAVVRDVGVSDHWPLWLDLYPD